MLNKEASPYLHLTRYLVDMAFRERFGRFSYFAQSFVRLHGVMTFLTARIRLCVLSTCVSTQS